MAGYVNPQFQNMMQNDPRYQLAHSLLQNGLAPQTGEAGGLGVLAQALTAGLGAYETKNLSNEYKGRQQTAATDLSSALGQINGRDAETQGYKDGTNINWDAQAPDMNAGIRTLASNPDTADVATQLQLKQIEAKQSLANKLAELNAPLSNKDKMDYAYKDREMTTDAFGNTIPKYQQAGQSPSGVMPPDGKMGMDMLSQGAMAGIDPRIANSPKVQMAKAEAAAKQQVSQEATTHTNVSGAQEFLAKSKDLRSLLQKQNPDGSFAYDKNGNPIAKEGADDIFGKIQGSPLGQGIQNFTNSDASARRDQVENQLSNLELSVAQMKLKGQGQITDAERAIARNTLPKFTNVDASTALKNLDQTEAEAKRILGKSQTNMQPKVQAALAAGYTQAEIDSFLNGQ